MNKKPVTHVNQNTTHFLVKATLEFEQNLIQVLTLDLYVPATILCCYKAIIIFMQLVFNSQLIHRYANYNHTPS